MGRPKSKEPTLTHRVVFRVTEHEAKVLMDYAKEKGTDVTSITRPPILKLVEAIETLKVAA